MTDESTPDQSIPDQSIPDASTPGANIPGDARLPGGDEPDDLADYEAIQDDDARTGENYYEEMIDTTGPFIEGGDDVDTGAGRPRSRE